MDDIKLYDCTRNGQCSNCGNCCSNFLPLSNDEVGWIKAYIRKHKIKEQRQNVAAGYEMTCPFRDEVNKKCLIYPIRPAICRKFMCNHKRDDIMSATFDFRKKWRVVFMRTEFFGNKESERVMWETIYRNLGGE